MWMEEESRMMGYMGIGELYKIDDRWGSCGGGECRICPGGGSNDQTCRPSGCLGHKLVIVIVEIIWGAVCVCGRGGGGQSHLFVIHENKKQTSTVFSHQVIQLRYVPIPVGG